MNEKKLLILGAGGHGKAVAEAALLSGDWDSIAFVDDRWPNLQEFSGWPVLSNVVDLPEIASTWTFAIAAVGNNLLRAQWFQSIKESGLKLVTVIHPAASVSPSARIGDGSAIMALAMVGTDSQLGDGVIVNAHATVDHDARVDDFAHLGVGVHLAGGVQIGCHAWLQAGSCVGYHVVVPDQMVCQPGTILFVGKSDCNTG